MNPASRPKCLQSALDGSPPKRSTSRFAARVLGSDPSPAEYNKLNKDLSGLGEQLLNQKTALDKAVADKHQNNTEEGFGRLDALNRIGNQVFSTDMATSGLSEIGRAHV